MKIVVTGGLGYIGSRIARRLIENGHHVIIVDADLSPTRGDRPPCEVIRGDITDFENMKSIDVAHVDAVLHLAAQSSGPRSFSIPDVDFKINILGTLNTIKWCKEKGIPRLLFASSFVVYGDNLNTEILGESDPCHPKSIYALSKHTCEQLLNIYATPHGINWNVLRMFNVYGPGQDLNRTDQGLVAIFLNYVKNGTHVPVKGRLDRFRDLIYIDDVVQGWELCLNDRSHKNEIFNLGSGVKTHISTLIDRIIDAWKKKGQVKVEEMGSTPGDMMGCYADISKISTQLGFKPRFTLNEGIAEMVKWARTL